MNSIGSTKPKSGVPRRNKQRRNRGSTGTDLNRSKSLFVRNRMITRVNCSQSGYVVAAAGAQGTFPISANNFAAPFVLSTYATGHANLFNAGAVGTTSLISPEDGSTGTKLYNGYTMGGDLYGMYRIHDSRIKVTCVPQSAIDVVHTELFCIPNSTYINLTFPQPSYVAVAEDNYASRINSAGGNPKALSRRVHMRDVLGYTPVQYSSTLPVAISNTPTNQVDDCIWVVQWKTNNGLATNGQIDFFLELEAGIEFCNPLAIVQ